MRQNPFHLTREHASRRRWNKPSKFSSQFQNSKPGTPGRRATRWLDDFAVLKAKTKSRDSVHQAKFRGRGQVQGNDIQSELRRIFPIMKMTDDQLKQWNDFNPPGSPCLLRLDDRSEIQTRTESVAWRLGHGSIVVKVEGKSGGWDLDRVKMMETHKP